MSIDQSYDSYDSNLEDSDSEDYDDSEDEYKNYDSLDFMLNPDLVDEYDQAYNLLSATYQAAFKEVWNTCLKLGRLDLDGLYTMVVFPKIYDNPTL